MIISCLYSKKIYVDSEQTKEGLAQIFAKASHAKVGEWFECDNQMAGVLNAKLNNNKKIYIVKPLDTFEGVASKLGVDVEYLKKQANTKNLFVGQRITF